MNPPIRVIAAIAGLFACGVLLVHYALGYWVAGGWDPALLPYAIALVVCTFALVQRLALWAQRPPTWAMLRRGLQAASQPRVWLGARWSGRRARMASMLSTHAITSR